MGPIEIERCDVDFPASGLLRDGDNLFPDVVAEPVRLHDDDGCDANDEEQPDKAEPDGQENPVAAADRNSSS